MPAPGGIGKEKDMPPNRIVAALTPVVALAAGAAAAWLSDFIPEELGVSTADMEAFFIAGLLAVLAPAAQWLYGSQKYERHQADLDQLALAADTEAAAAVSEAELAATADDDAEDYDDDDGYDDYDEDDGGDDGDYADALGEQQPAAVG
jgi:hypothetical protein